MASALWRFWVYGLVALPLDIARAGLTAVGAGRVGARLHARGAALLGMGGPIRGWRVLLSLPVDLLAFVVAAVPPVFLVGRGLRALLAMRGHEVIPIGDAQALHAAVAHDRPDVTVVDIRMPPTHTDEGLRAALRLRREHPGLGVLLFSQYIEVRYAAELLAGLSDGVGYLVKERVADIDDFTDALERVRAGGTALDPEVVRQLLGASRRRTAPDSRVSPRPRPLSRR